MKRRDLVKLLLLVTMVLISYIPTFKWMYARWSAADTYYSHGFLVPFITLFIIWTKRNTLKNLKIKPSNLGWLFLIPGILVHTLSTAWKVGFSSGFSLIVILIGLVLLCLGKEYLRHLAFPIIFLGFMIPIPEIVIANLSFKLKIFAAQISTLIVNKVGIPAIREGSVIKTAHSYVMVEDPCSGIRSLVALIALGALMAYFSDTTKIKKSVIFISSIPIAITTNIIRITAITMISEMYGEKFATGIFHDIMGVAVFIFAFIGLMIIRRLLE